MSGASRNTGFIRMAIMGGAFVGLTVVLLVFQPGAPRQAEVMPLPDSAVTRVAAPLAPETTQEPQTTAVALQPAPTIQNDDASMSMRDLTFNAISDLKSATTGEAPAPGQPGSLLHSVVQRSLGSQSAVQPSAPQPSATQASAALEPDTASEPRSIAKTYFVRPGDTLTSIARDVYGDIAMAGRIMDENRNLISRPNSLRAGMILELPQL